MKALIVIDVQQGLEKVFKFFKRKPYPYSIDEICQNNEKLIETFTEQEELVCLVNVVVPIMPKSIKQKFSKFLFSENQLKNESIEIFTKHSPSAFKTTNILQKLKEQNISEVYVTGIVTGNGVLKTVQDALQNEFKVNVIEGAMSDKSRTAHEEAIREIQKLNVPIIPFEEITKKD